MRTHRRALSTLAVLALTMGMITGIGVFPASAATVQVTIDNITYTADSGAQASGATVTSYTGAGGAVAIESSVTISGVTYAVTGVGNSVFALKKLTAVTIPGSVTTIGNYAFADNSLQTVSIPNGVTAINLGAFYNNQLSTVGIPDSVTTIGNDAFFRNSLASVTLPSALTSIGDGAFKSNSMATVTIPANVSTIGQNAFDTSVTNVFFLGLAPTITQAGTYGSFGFYPNKTLWYLYANRASFDAANGNVVWRQYTIAVFGTPFTTTTTPSISGTAQVGQTLTAHISRWWTWSPIPTTISYAWTRSGSADVLGTDDTYLPTMADIGSTLVVTVTGDRLGYASAVVTSLPTATVVPSTFASIPTPTITGTAQVGGALSSNTGTWPSDTTFAYAWRQIGAATILGTTSTYTPTAADLGKYLTLTVTASLTGYSDAVVTSAPTSAVVAGILSNTVAPSITGTAQVGTALSSNTGTWPSDTTFAYAWRQVGAATILGTLSTYTPVATDLGKLLTLTVTASLTGYTDTAVTSAPTIAVVAGVFSNTVAPTITGTAQVGQRLTASTGAWASGASFTYSWRRSGTTAPVGTASTYTPVAADIGKTLSVTVTATRAGYTTATTPARTTTAVLGRAFTTSPTPTISGTTTTGSTLTAATGTWNPSASVTYTYVWSRATGIAGVLTPISGAKSKTYTLVAADKGKYLTVTVTATLTGYATTSKTSARKLMSN